MKRKSASAGDKSPNPRIQPFGKLRAMAMAICGLLLAVLPVQGQYTWTNVAGRTSGVGFLDGNGVTARLDGPLGIVMTPAGFAAAGSHAGFNSDFKLVGDTVSGGLAVETLSGLSTVPV